jgi:hypothetical protein
MNGYLFPDESLGQSENDALLSFIERYLPDAKDQTDGSDHHSDVRIDYAQDLIEQARDLLLARGHVFSAEAQSELDFLSWPLSDAEKAAAEQEEAARRIERAAAYDKFKKSKVAMEAGVEAALGGRDIPDELLRGLELSIGAQIPSDKAVATSGAQVLEMVAQIERITGQKPGLGYGCSRMGVTFAEDPHPAWSLHFALTNQPELWVLIRAWMRLPIRPWAEAWDRKPESYDNFHSYPHVSVTHLFQEHAERHPLLGEAPLVPTEVSDDAG